MRLILLTLKKDVRRLWPAAAVTWVMLAALANADHWRADWIASPMEGWINVLLPMAWACVAALAVLEEPLVGDVNFWTTRPHKWPALLVAKLIFVVLAIHLPSFLADVFVLSARGFSPVENFGVLLWKQILFFSAVTLPSIAVASLVSSFTHFVIAVFTIAAGLAMLNGGLQGVPDFSRLPHEDAVHHAVVRILLLAASLAVISVQYARRRVLPARVMAVATGLAAASISAWLPARAEYTLRGGPKDAPRVTLRNASAADPGFRGTVGGRQPIVLLPIAFTPGPGSDSFHVSILELELLGPDGLHIQATRPSANRPFEKIDLMTYTTTLHQRMIIAGRGENPSQEILPDWLALNFSGTAWERVKNARVRVRGTATFNFYRAGEKVILTVPGSASVPNLGRCTAMNVDDRFKDSMLKVLCESTQEIPVARVTLRHQAAGRDWRDSLNSSRRYTPGPRETWLSPLYRAQSFFQLSDAVESAPGSQWLFPRSYLSSAHVEITPEIVTGRALADFDFGEVNLGSWLVPR